MHYLIMVAVVPAVLGLLAFAVVRMAVGSDTSSTIAWAYSAGLSTAYLWIGGYLLVTFGESALTSGIVWLLLFGIATSYVLPKWTHEFFLRLGGASGRTRAGSDSPGNRRREIIAIGVVLLVAVTFTLLQVWSSVR